MAETTAFIKHEPDDQPSNPHQYLMSSSTFGMPSPSFGSNFGNPGGNEGIDPSELSMQNGGFMSYPFSSQHNLSSSFNLGNSSIDTAELLDLDLNGQGGVGRDNNLSFVQDPQRHPTGISMSHQGQMTNVYSSTPEGAPIQNPYVRNNFNYEQFRVSHGQHATSPHVSLNTHFDQHYANGRPSFQGIDRNSTDARSPMTPKTPAIAGLNIGTPESGSFPSQPMRVVSLQNRHQKTLSNQWDGTPGSAQSLIESPISSPGHLSHHTGISEILKSGKHASLPAKVDSVHGHHQNSSQTLESQEAKRRRRRASHNMVERRRRDNINERIQDLSHLVPQHRLEDDKIRKQLVNNSALATSTGGSGLSPTNAATSLLAGGSGRRATPGNITMGLPIEEKEKGPNKGDILNGAVGWTRDLMWAMHVKLQQEDELAELITSLGGTWPFEQTEEEKRMRTELIDAMEKNDPNTFFYSRAPGSGLRVPKHTNIAGEALPQQNQTDTLSPQSLSPGFHSGGSGNNSGGTQPQYWNSSGHAGMSFKEEDEYSMEMN
ncbi:HLH transcription factor (GlcD gamma) [Paracoccidioides lutzii Pb01]|uniref:HLH transcription factor (GlcD gamma) n=1 Tax=Paracoccidioides lutzii (strain ATCC MYA-826 / Pb01) TaxID=502779 RepID=C1GWA3_PARBA|nr:HLH transcription factor (GlcD gamma) [Paracoccidioides lutzii Pb01]EEH40822.1 HLH transcription factor (GlcD gamma) [Paracoccidioides lutzii Pb01]